MPVSSVVSKIKNVGVQKKIIFFILIFVSLIFSCSKNNDGTYEVSVRLEGGSGKSFIKSPSILRIQNQQKILTVQWSSKNYDYMLVDGKKYLNETPGDFSTFTFPIKNLQKIPVAANTAAMGSPHQIEYTLVFDSDLASNFTKLKSEDSRKTRPESEIASKTNQKNLSSDESAFPLRTTSEKIPLQYARQFAIEKVDGGTLLSIEGEKAIFVVAENSEPPKNLPSSVCVLRQPVNNAYLLSTSVMDFLSKLKVVSHVRFAGTKKSDWFIDEALSAFESGSLRFAGKYSAPDYELLLSQKCDLAIENTMIYHKTEVKEKLEELGIPVIVEKSTYEQNPLGRLEWIKFWGVIFNREAEANRFFDEQVLRIQSAIKENPSESRQKKVAFFYVTTNGAVNVRKPNDYIARLIELSGLEYVPRVNVGEDSSAVATVNIQMEEFYLLARDADVLIYNGNITGEISSIEDLLLKNPLFADFEAVKNKRVYFVGKKFFQETTGMAKFIEDLRKF